LCHLPPPRWLASGLVVKPLILGEDTTSAPYLHPPRGYILSRAVNRHTSVDFHLTSLAHAALKSATMFSTMISSPRLALAQTLNFALVLATAFMMWKGLSVLSDSPSPIVVVLSGSMEPAFQRGDILLLWNRGADTQIGEIVVYNVKGKDIPIVHRVVRRYGGG